MNSKFKITHLFLNSNPWFSAVSDYSLQIALYVKTNHNILYCAEVGSTAMKDKCKQYDIPFVHSPIHNQTFINFFKSLFLLIKILSNHKQDLKYIWVFEGREHTLCCITKILFPFFWRGKKLIRVRGQAQNIKSNFVSKYIYNKITDKIIFAAECVKKRVQFNLKKDKFIVHYYGKTLFPVKDNNTSFLIHPSLPSIDAKKIVFTVIGRFDPVKGHDYLTEAYLKAKFKDLKGNFIKTQMVYIGYKANVNPKDIYSKYLNIFGEGKYIDSKYYLENKNENKELFIIEEKIANIENLLSITAFGVIPSLDSEVICRVGVEFLQSGVPVLSSNVGALPEVFSDFPELIFNAGDINSLTNKLENSLNLFLDNEKYSNLKEKSKNIGIEKFSSHNYKNMINFIDKK